MLTAKDLMSTDVIAVTKDTTVRDLACILSDKRVSGVPVLDDTGKVIGVVTESDLIFQNKKLHIPTALAILDAFIFIENPETMERELRKIAGTKVGDIYTRKPVMVRQHTPLDEVATLMSEKRIHTLPVLGDKDQLVGVIGKLDIIRVIAEGKY